MTIEPTAALLDAYYASWTAGPASFDEGRLLAILAPDLAFDGPIAGRRAGVEPFLKGLADVARAVTSYVPVRQVHAADTAATVYDCTIGAAGGTLRFGEFFRVRDNQISEITLLYDATEFRKLMAAAQSG